MFSKEASEVNLLTLPDYCKQKKCLSDILKHVVDCDFCKGYIVGYLGLSKGE